MFGSLFGGNSAKFKNATVHETQQAVTEDGAQFIDVRTPAEYAGGHAEKAFSMPLDKLGQTLEKLDKSKPVYVICQSGMRSQTGARILNDAGFEEVYNVAGGTIAWLSAGLPAKR